MSNNIRVYKMRNHNLSIEEDDVDVVDFYNLTDEQARMLREVAYDSVWFDTELIQD